MNKVLFFIFLFLFTTLVEAFAQQETFKKGSMVMDLSVGTPTSSGAQNRNVIVPPVTMTLDFGGPSGFLHKKSKSKKGGKGGKGAFGFGAVFSFYEDDCWGWDDGHYYDGYYDYYGWYDANVYNAVAAFRFSFHYEPVKHMDVYFGLLTGGRFRIWDYNEEYYPHQGDDPKGHTFCFGPFTGMRYYFGKVFGVKAEFSIDTGSGLPNASTGIVLKFK
ncbi:MAG TPA: hypothetical protein PLN63_02285 [Paludibacteraceae bacterium]|nr:hypothetical protein [Paludibacteraceae bacterium]HPH62440.1 hypothetical protein [Paludibacteraceae bacterium]